MITGQYCAAIRKFSAAAMAIATLLVFDAPLAAQRIITTIAGGPKSIADGVLSPLTTPILPVVVAYGRNGDIFMIEQSSHSVLKLTAAGQLTRVAGVGLDGYSGDGGPAVNAALSSPAGLAVDAAGNLYISDSANNRVRRVDTNGIITTVAGTGTSGFSGDNGPAAAAQIVLPAGLAFDTAGNLLIADRGNFRVRRISTSGTITTIAGIGFTGFTATGDGGSARDAGFAFPEFVATDSNGNVYISDSNAFRVRRINPQGIISTIAGNGQFGGGPDGGPATQGPITIPQGLATDNAGNVYFADQVAHRIRRVTPAGTISTVAGNGVAAFSGDGGAATASSLAMPKSIAIDGSGNIAIADVDNARLRIVSSAGVIRTAAGTGQAFVIGDGGVATSSGLHSPAGMGIGPNGSILFADRSNQRVRSISSTGVITTVAGNGTIAFSGDNGAATQASLAYPSGVAADAAGNIYIADKNNNRVRRVDSEGRISTFAGKAEQGFSGDNGQAIAASLSFPSGVAVIGGNVYIADTGNHRVRRVNSLGVITTVAGNGQPGFSGDGGAATSASLRSPGAIAGDAAGNLYIADSENLRIRKVSTNGVISTFAGTGQQGGSGDGGPAASATMFGPTGVTVDSAGVVYIVDRQNQKIRIVDTSGIIRTMVGTGASGFLGDGGLASEARLHLPEGVAVDGAGNLYISDSENHRIRAVLATPPSFTVDAPSLSFTAVSDGQVTAARSVTAIPITGSQVFNASGMPATATSDASWIRVTPDKGILPLRATVNVDPTGLSPGNHTAAVRINSPLAVPSIRTVLVSVDVAAPTPAQLSLNTGTLTFALTQGDPKATKDLIVTNTGSGSLQYSVTAKTEGTAWLTVAESQGTASAANPGTITVTANPASLAPGTYIGSLVITSSGQEKTVPVTLAVSKSPNKMLLSQTGLTFRGSSGGGSPLPQQIGVINGGQGTMNWIAEAKTLSGGDWLSISRRAGQARAASGPDLVDVIANASRLTPGDYYGQIEIRSSDADNSPQLISVQAKVLSGAADTGPEIRPSGLVFIGTPSTAPSAQNAYISNFSTKALNFVSSTFTADGQPWFKYTPVSDTVPANLPKRVTVQPDFSGLAPGVYRGAITFQSVEDGSLSTLNVLSVVNADTTGKDAQRNANGCVPKEVRVLSTGTDTSITTTAGEAVALEVTVVDSCGEFITNATPSSSVTLSLSDGTPGGSLVYSGSGKWSKTYQPRTTTAGRVTATVTAFLALPSAQLLGGQLEIAVTIAARDRTPVVGPQGVQNAASLESNQPLAPGAFVTLKGEQLAPPGDGAVAPPGALPLQLKGAEVRLGGRPLPLLYAADGQINAQLPYDLALNTQHQLVIYRDNALSVPEPFTVAETKPAVFAVNFQGTGQGAIVNAVTNQVADAGHPVAADDIITIYCTGLGAISPPVPEGAIAPLSPLSRTIFPPSVTVGGLSAQVLFSGLSPLSTGLYQINAVVPAGATGDEVAVVVEVGGQRSAPVTIAVH